MGYIVFDIFHDNNKTIINFNRFICVSDKYVLLVRSKCLQLIQIAKIIESVFIKKNTTTRAHNKNRDGIVNETLPKDDDNGT